MSRLAALVLSLLLPSGVCAQESASSAPPPAVVVEHVVAHISMTGPVTDQMAADFEKALVDAAELHADEVRITIDSPGGSVDAGRRISRDIEHALVPVSCTVDGEADSMAFYILQSCPLRAMTTRSVLMAHEVIQMVGGALTVAMFTAEDLENLAAETHAESEALAHQCAARLKVSLAEYKRRTRAGRRWWMTADEALRVGAVDEVLDSPNRALR